MTTPSAHRRSSADRALVAVAYLTIALCCLLILSFDYGRDQGIFALVARTVTEGGMPYRDAWDFKPPGIYLVYAASRAIFGNAQWGIRLLEVLGLCASIYGMTILTERWWDDARIGLVAGAFYAVVHAQLDFWHTAQPETFGGMLTVAGIVIGTAGDHNRANWRYIAAGCLLGAAGLLKPPLAGGGAVLALWAAWQGLPHREHKGWLRIAMGWRAALRPILMVLFGGVLPFGICLVWFAAKGALGALYETLFVFTPHYTALGWKDASIVGLAYHAFADWLVKFSSLLSAGLLLALASWRRVWDRPGVGLLLGIIAIQLLGVALQGKFFPYHYAAQWPITAMIAALGWWHAWRWAVDRRGRLAPLLFAVATLFIATFRTATRDMSDTFWERTVRRARVTFIDRDDQQAIDGLSTVADVNTKGNRDVAEELARRCPPNGSVYIWGFEPVIYDLADRAFASRYIYNVPQRVDWAAPAARSELMSDLEASPPDVMVIADADVFPMVTGNTIGSREVMEKHFPELRAFLEANYGKVKRIQDFDIWIQK